MIYVRFKGLLEHKVLCHLDDFPLCILWTRQVLMLQH